MQYKYKCVDLILQMTLPILKYTFELVGKFSETLKLTFTKCFHPNE